MNRGDHNYILEDPSLLEAYRAVLQDMVLSDIESASSIAESEETEDVGPSEAESFDEDESGIEPEAPFRLPGVAALHAAFLLLGGVILVEEMQERPCIMKSVPRFLRGNCPIVMRTALEEICAGERSREEARAERGWKLFILLPRMLLHRQPRGGPIPRAMLISRFESFVRGAWGSLIQASRACNTQAAVVRQHRSRRVGDNLEHRAARAEVLVHMEELSSARQALEGAELAPGSRHTLNMLQDESKRPRNARVPIPPPLGNLRPRVPFPLDRDRLARNLRSAKRGASGGPSGMIVEHLHPLLDYSRDSQLFFQAAELLARAQVPPAIKEAIRLGRLTALRKPDGGVRGIVAGDIVRRLVARTISQQLSEGVQAASTRAGCECVAHALQGITEMSATATITSVDGISAYDLISRRTMLEGLRGVDESAVPFVSMFYSSPSGKL